MNREIIEKSPRVLVGVLNTPRDLEILKNEGWYRIPLAAAPKQDYEYVAFYQPAVFGREGKRIAHFGPIKTRETVKRIVLLPHEVSHPRAEADYLKITLEHLVTLPHPIRNIIPRRVTFGFTTLSRLLAAHELLALFDVPRTEQIVAVALAQEGIATRPEVTISGKRKRVRVDLVIDCQKGKIAIECDNRRAHLSQSQKLKDRRKDAWLRRRGWRVIRLSEERISKQLDACLNWIKKEVNSLGGL